ncbi:MAG: methionine synthase [Candidatus Schekmanbacteria bacterium]|nr:methionine synthase [Candidatus Schekmanbacteria bacterium]
MNRSSRLSLMHKAIQERVLVLDGAMGTSLQKLALGPADFGGEELEGCNENLVFTRPDVVTRIHESYLAAGADIVETNSFGGTPLVLAEYGLAHCAFEINAAAARIARQAADAASDGQRQRWVAGSMGPTTKALSVTGGVTFARLVEDYAVQARGLHAGGVDYFLVETCQDTRNIKAALLAIDRVAAETGEALPVAVSATIETTGTMLAGQAVDALAASLDRRDLLYLGLNCATGPEFMTDHIRTLAQMTAFPVGCVPNAGLPDENGTYLETPAMIARVIERFCEAGWVNFVGGCCGTQPEHIAALRSVADRARPRAFQPRRRCQVSGVDFLEIDDEKRPVIVGERTNVIGSRQFRRLIAEDKLQEAAEVARAQVRGGAQIVDVCLASPDRDEAADMRCFLEVLIHKVRAPLMIDSTDAAVIAEALTYSQGKAIINSINLEDGRERFEKVVPLAKSFGAALVVGLIDDDPVQGMAVSRERKVAVAERAHGMLTGEFGIAPEDIIWDPLTFPCATGDAQYRGAAVETIEGIRLVKQRFPGTRTILGISNVSFGLPAAGREVLNAVFLYHCVQAGLDLAIVNAEKLVRYPSIPEEERRLAEDLLWMRGDDPVAAFAAYFRDRAPVVVEKETLPLDRRLARYIVEGTRDGLEADLEAALQSGQWDAMGLINGPLMAGMDEVGRLFNDNQLIVAEVLQSAESMKAAVRYLEPHLEDVTGPLRGRVVLATVKGDVHDIGKNLVDIVLSNNGFEVVNLGIKVNPAQLIASARELRPDIIGLSGLLVKSAHQMVATAEDLRAAGIDAPLLVGGAALSERFVNTRIAPAYDGTVCYARDAMEGLSLAKRLVDPTEHAALKLGLARKQTAVPGDAAAPAGVAGGERAAVPGAPAVRRLEAAEIPKAPDFDAHVIGDIALDHLWRYVNPRMLYGRHLGLNGTLARRVDSTSAAELLRLDGGAKAVALKAAMDAVRARCREGAMRARGIYRFFRAASAGDQIHLFLTEGAATPAASLAFPRQQEGTHLCIADYVAPAAANGAAADTVALLVVTAGLGVRQAAEDLKARGEYLASYALQALALETAEAFAELLHAQIRNAWGFADPADMTMEQRFKAQYRGRRYSFGYPACPALEDQGTLFELLAPERIGVTLTDGFMMEPEASVSAMVFHHPDARYFSA